jgi:hypothetical protein
MPSTIELHPERGRIEFELGMGTPRAAVAKKFGVSRKACDRHFKKMPAQLKASLFRDRMKRGADLEKLRVDESEGLLQGLALQRARLLLVQDRAIDLEQFGIVSQIAGQLHRNAELVGKYLGEFASHSVQTSVSILIQPEYLELRSALLRALHPYPEARKAIAAALHQIEGRAAALPQLPAPTPPPPVTIDATANPPVASDG